MRKLVFILLIFAVQLASGALATTYYVDSVNGDNANAGTAPGAGNAWKTITYAAATSAANDTIQIAAGTYSTIEGEAFPINLGSSRNYIGSGVVRITCSTNSGIVTLGASTTLEGVSIMGAATATTTVLVAIAGATTAEVRSCKILNNDSRYGRGVGQTALTKGKVYKTEIRDCYYGIYPTGTSGNLANLLADRNTIVRFGSIGIYAAYAVAMVKNNIIAKQPEGGGPTAGTGLQYGTGASGTYSYNDFYGNKTSATAGTNGGGNISRVASFISIPNNNYLIADSSPCIDAGEGGVDIGAYDQAYAAPQVYFVKTGGSDSNNGLSPAAAWKTITYAAANTYTGDMISIEAGTYNAALGEVFPINMGADKYYKAFSTGVSIECATNTTLVTLLDGTTLEGTTIKGAATSTAMNLVAIPGASTAEVRSCKINNNNSSFGRGVGLDVNSKGKVYKTEIRDCQYGIYPEGASSNLANLLADRDTIVNFGGTGITASNAVVTVKNSIIARQPDGGAPTAGTGVNYGSGATGTYSYNDFYGNKTSATAGTDGGGNISRVASFISIPNNNYLIADSSPCIDAGEGGVDIGAYDQAYAAPQVYFVKTDGSDSNNGLSPAAAWKTITYAAANTYTGDMISIEAGTYNAALGEVFPINLGADKYYRAFSPAVTVECAANLTLVTLYDGTTLEGTTIKGTASSTATKLVSIIGASTAEVRSCKIFNSSSSNGRGVGLTDNSKGKVYKTEIRDCQYGIYPEGASSNLANLLADRNTIVKFGTTGITASNAVVAVKNSIISKQPGVGAPGGTGLNYGSGATGPYSYNDFYGNTTNVTGAGGTNGGGNITLEAQFVDVPNNIFFLQAASPCIDTGTPEGTEMGAYDYFAGGAAYDSPVGNAGAWIWATPDGSSTVMSGTPEGWIWQTWQGGSGRKVPQGTPGNWNWGNE